MGKNNFYIINGGPGVGKTTLINEFSKNGFLTQEEEARKIIRKQLAKNGDGVPWLNKTLYAQLMLNASIRTYDKMKRDKPSDIVFFDRGVLDTVCYMNMERIPVPDKMCAAIHTCVYNKKIFILPPWKEIYHTDKERRQSWREAIRTFEIMKETYLDNGYEVIEIPKLPTLERLHFILEIVAPF